MKTTAWILLLLTGFSVAAQTNSPPDCCRHPVRIIGSQTAVNLTPLFHWWTERTRAGQASADTTGNGDAARPLSAWQRITGFKTGQLGTDWVVNAIIETEPGDTTNTSRQIIILKNPPVAEEQRYLRLKHQLPEAAQQIADDQKTYDAETLSAKKAQAASDRYDGTGKWPALARSNENKAVAARHRAAAAAALKEQKELQAAYSRAQKEFNAIPTVDGRYQIDWFGLEFGPNSQGVPIFDLGALPGKTR